MISYLSIVISHMISYMKLEQTFSFRRRCTCCCLPTAFLCLLRPFPCLTHLILPDSFRLINGHRPGLAPSVAPQPEIHLVNSAAIPAILLGIGGCRPQESAVGIFG